MWAMRGTWGGAEVIHRPFSRLRVRRIFTTVLSNISIFWSSSVCGPLDCLASRSSSLRRGVVLVLPLEKLLPFPLVTLEHFFSERGRCIQTKRREVAVIGSGYRNVSYKPISGEYPKASHVFVFEAVRAAESPSSRAFMTKAPAQIPSALQLRHESCSLQFHKRLLSRMLKRTIDHDSLDSNAVLLRERVLQGNLDSL